MLNESILLPHVRGWRQELIGIGRSKNTVAVRVSYVTRFMRWVDLPLEEITRTHLVGWLAEHPTWEKDTRRSAIASLRGFFTWAHRTGLVTVNAAADLPSAGRKRAVPAPAADYDVMEAIRQSPEWVALAIEVIATCGLRRSEVATLKDSLIQPDGQGWIIRVTGKGDVTRIIPCPPHLALRLKKRKGWTFPGGQHGHVSAGWLGKMISRALPPGVTAHKLRHRFASVSYAKTHDLRAIQELLGHASLATTQVYVRVSTTETREAAQAAWHIAA